MVFLFFLNGAAIPATKDNFTERGHFHFDNNTYLPSLVGSRNDSLFIRGANNLYNAGAPKDKRGHGTNQAGVWTAHPYQPSGEKLAGVDGEDANAGTSVNILAGKHLQNIYKTKVPHLNLAYWDKHGDATTDNHPFLWETSTFIKSKPCLLYTSPSPRDQRGSRMPSSA